MNNTHLSRAILLAAVLIPQLCTAQVTWSGAGANANWSTPENWAGVAPMDGDALVFAGNQQLVNNNNLTLLSNAWVRFEAGGFELKGNGLTLVQGITNLVGLNKVSLNLDWATNLARIYAVAPDTELVIAGTDTTLGGDHTYVGGGRLRLTGTHVQTPNPPATILNNIEYVVDGGSFSSAGGVRITSGTTPSASKLILTNGATMNQTLAAGAIRVGDAASISGQLIIDHSTLTHVGGNIFIPFIASGIGVVTQTGGTNSGADIAFCNGASGDGTYNMVGGTLEALRIRRVKAGPAAISFDGSTLRPVASTTFASTFFTNLTTAELKSGGLTLDNNGLDLTVGQVFSGSGGLTKVGDGALTLYGGSTYAGGFTLNAGAVALAANNPFGTGTLTINGGTLQPSASANRSATNAVVLAGDYTAAGNANLTFSGPITLTGNRTITANTTHILSGPIGESGGTWGLTKQGGGTLQISGSANSYSGDTAVTAGTLKVTNPSGSATGSGAVQVTSTGVLSGNGGVGTLALSAGGKVAPGTGVGTLKATSATFGAGGVYQVEMSDADTNLLAGAGVDLLNISGSLAITATAASPFVIELSSLGALAAHFDNTQSYSWVIASAAGGITGFAPDAFVISTNGFQNDLGSSVFSVAVQGNNLVLKFGSNVVPQPTIYPLTGAGTSNTALSWSSVAGASYTVQYKTNLLQVGWLNLTNVTGTGATTTIIDNTSPVPAERYYRIISP